MLYEEKPTLNNAMIHYGVLGMKWGVTRQQARGGDIRAARARLVLERQKVKQAKRKVSEASTAKDKAAAAQKHVDLKMGLLNNSDRVIASRLTTGEKVATALLFSPVGAAALIGTTSATSRRIEYKQDKGKYTKT